MSPCKCAFVFNKSLFIIVTVAPMLGVHQWRCTSYSVCGTCCWSQSCCGSIFWPWSSKYKTFGEIPLKTKTHLVTFPVSYPVPTRWWWTVQTSCSRGRFLLCWFSCYRWFYIGNTASLHRLLNWSVENQYLIFSRIFCWYFCIWKTFRLGKNEWETITGKLQTNWLQVCVEESSSI